MNSYQVDRLRDASVHSEVLQLFSTSTFVKHHKQINMKKLIVSILFLALIGCQDENVSPRIGCLTGVPNGLKQRTYIGCFTKEQYLNQEVGKWDAFSRHEWKPVDKCEDCQGILKN